MNKNQVNICHLTSAHTRGDVRIFKKECLSIKKAGYKVNLIVADGLGDDLVDGVQIYDIGKLKGRFNRFTKTTAKIFKKAIELDADLYHFHDSDLMPVGLKLIKKGKKVIYDVHEDLPSQILAKPYIKVYLRKPVSKILKAFENYCSRKYTYIITATPHIKSIFDSRNYALDINNYPFPNELNTDSVDYNNKPKEICFTGAISEIRGLKEVVKGIKNLDIKLNLAGKIQQKYFREDLISTDGWHNVNELGLVSREQVKNILSKSRIGIVTFLPSPNHTFSQPNKLFEYMSAGIPVVASNFDLWKLIVEDYNCGICVNPESPQEIENAIKKLIDNPEIAKKMGENGREAVKTKFNWESEEKKLIRLYEEIL